MEPKTDYWSVLAPIWHSISIRQSPEAYIALFANATQPQQTLYAAHWCRLTLMDAAEAHLRRSGGSSIVSGFSPSCDSGGGQTPS